jgi:hypothetical protein
MRKYVLEYYSCTIVMTMMWVPGTEQVKMICPYVRIQEYITRNTSFAPKTKAQLFYAHVVMVPWVTFVIFYATMADYCVQVAKYEASYLAAFSESEPRPSKNIASLSSISLTRTLLGSFHGSGSSKGHFHFP